MANIYHMDGIVIFVLLVICTCAYMKRVTRLRDFFLSEKKGFFGALHKGTMMAAFAWLVLALNNSRAAHGLASVIGTRLHFFVAITAAATGVYLLFFK
jgi:hypothetical protein